MSVLPSNPAALSATTNVDLNDVRVVKALGGTVDETELVHGLVFTNKASHVAGAPTRATSAKIGLIQFCLSAPKTDMENQVVVSEYSQMDRILKEERTYILNLCKAVQKSGCNVLLVQKSILRDSVNGALFGRVSLLCCKTSSFPLSLAVSQTSLCIFWPR